VLSAQAAGALLTLQQARVFGLVSCSLGCLPAVCAAAFVVVVVVLVFLWQQEG
jgi:hypothetical protein